MRIARQLLEAVLIVLGLAGLAEADLVRRNHPVAGIAQTLDGRLPGGRAKVLAMEQHRRTAVGMHWLDVHIRHMQGNALRSEIVLLDWRRIVEALQFGAVGGT